jgi:predicted dehydrogenase
MGSVHAANLARACPSAELIACYDRDPDVARAAAERYGAVAVPSVEDLLGIEGLDGLVIAAPTAAHAPLALAAAEAGLGTFVEKPIALDRRSTLQVVERFEAARLALQVGFNRRFDESVADVHRRVRAGELGPPYFLRISQRDMAPPRPEFLAGSGGIFLDMGIHDFDLARFLVGDVARVSAVGAALADPGLRDIGDFDTAVATLEFANGALGVVDLGRAAGYGYESSAELVGATATVRLETPPALAAEWLRAGEATRPLLRSYDRRYGPAFAAELEAFARALLDGTPVPVTGRDALAAFEVALAATRSCALGRPVSLDEVVE